MTTATTTTTTTTTTTNGHRPLGSKPALVLAGGGHKVAFQAGALQVLLDEVPELTNKFAIADGTSGGTFNLAMLCQGLSGSQIADNWRRFSPSKGISPAWGQLLRGPWASGLFTFKRYRSTVFPAWGLTWPTIGGPALDATFNVYDFTHQRLRAVEARDMNENLLVAANSIPFWFPPVTDGGTTYVDAVYVTDANLEAAIEAGADDLFIIWTVSKKGIWRPGFLAQYFQTIEEAANGQLERLLKRIDANNEAIRRCPHPRTGEPGCGCCGEFGRIIDRRVLQAEVPLHYIVNFSRDRMAAAVELGVQRTRTWCEKGGFVVNRPEEAQYETRPGLRFSETMKGRFAFGADVRPQGVGEPGSEPITLHLAVRIDGIGHFVTDPHHVATVGGWVDAPSLGGRCEVDAGTLNLLPVDEDPSDARMLYSLDLSDPVGHAFHLVGVKHLHNDRGWDFWKDSTTLEITLWSGRSDDTDGEPARIGAGIARISPLGFLRQVASLRTQARSVPEGAEALLRFGQMFFGRLFDVFGQAVVSSSPM